PARRCPPDELAEAAEQRQAPDDAQQAPAPAAPQRHQTDRRVSAGDQQIDADAVQHAQPLDTPLAHREQVVESAGQVQQDQRRPRFACRSAARFNSGGKLIPVVVRMVSLLPRPILVILYKEVIIVNSCYFLTIAICLGTPLTIVEREARRAEETYRVQFYTA